MLHPCENPNCSVHFPDACAVCPACGTLATFDEQPGNSTPTGAAKPTIVTAGDATMTDVERRGRNVLITMLLMMILLDVTGNLFTLTGLGSSPFFGLVHLAFTLLLCREMYSGSVAARHITVGLCILAGVLLIFAMLGGQDPIVSFVGFALVIGLTVFSVNLVHSPSINAFMAFQRKKEHESFRKMFSPRGDEK
jgi:hypothetical protein